MAQILSLAPATPSYKTQTLSHRRSSSRRILAAPSSPTHSWASLSHSVKCNGRFSCLFSNNRRQDEARKALESALGEKKADFENWNKEIKRREEAGGGGGNSGVAVGGLDGAVGLVGPTVTVERFWQEAQQATLTILVIFVIYMIVVKGDAVLAVVFNPLLFSLRGARTAFTLLISKIKNRIYGENLGGPPQEEVAVPVQVSAKDRVVGKWGSN